MMYNIVSKTFEQKLSIVAKYMLKKIKNFFVLKEIDKNIVKFPKKKTWNFLKKFLKKIDKKQFFFSKNKKKRKKDKKNLKKLKKQVHKLKKNQRKKIRGKSKKKNLSMELSNCTDGLVLEQHILISFYCVILDIFGIPNINV